MTAKRPKDQWRLQPLSNASLLEMESASEQLFRDYVAVRTDPEADDWTTDEDEALPLDTDKMHAYVDFPPGSGAAQGSDEQASGSAGPAVSLPPGTAGASSASRPSAAVAAPNIWAHDQLGMLLPDAPGSEHQKKHSYYGKKREEQGAPDKGQPHWVFDPSGNLASAARGAPFGARAKGKPPGLRPTEPPAAVKARPSTFLHGPFARNHFLCVLQELVAAQRMGAWENRPTTTPSTWTPTSSGPRRARSPGCARRCPHTPPAPRATSRGTSPTRRSRTCSPTSCAWPRRRTAASTATSS